MLSNGYVAPLLQRVLLSTIPSNSSLGKGTHSSIWGWRTKGSIQVLSNTGSALELAVNPYEIAEATYCDIQHLMNHATEHRAYLVNALATDKDPSPSWTFVTAYYWALFLSLALSRIQNKAIVFLDRDSVQAMSAGVVGSTPGGGVFRISLDVFETTSRRKALLSKSRNSHFHEVVWSDVFQFATTQVNVLEFTSKERKLSEDEMLDLRAFRCFTGVRFKEPHAWQSTLRNAINYRHGFSYRSITENNDLRLFKLIQTPSKINLKMLVEECEIAVSELKSIRDPLESPAISASLLIYQALILDAYCRAALDGFCENRGIDTYLAQKRSQFLAAYFEPEKSNLLLPLLDF
jgi:hypothetical protein